MGFLAFIGQAGCYVPSRRVGRMELLFESAM